MATDWNKLTVGQLKDELTKRGLETTGKKADLIERITEAECNDVPAAADDSATKPAESMAAMMSFFSQIGGANGTENNTSDAPDSTAEHADVQDASADHADDAHDANAEHAGAAPEETPEEQPDAEVGMDQEEEVQQPQQDDEGPGELDLHVDEDEDVEESEEVTQMEGKADADETMLSDTEKTDEVNDTKTSTPETEKPSPAPPKRKFKFPFPSQMWTETSESRARKGVGVTRLTMADLSHPVIHSCIETCTSFSNNFYCTMEEGVPSWKGQLKLYYRKESDAVLAAEKLAAFRDDLKVIVMSPPKTANEELSKAWDDRPHKRNDILDCLLFVRNLSEEVTEVDLWEVFPDAHDITLAYTEEHDKKVNAGYAYIVVTDPSKIKATIEKSNTVLHGMPIFITNYDDQFARNIPQPPKNLLAKIRGGGLIEHSARARYQEQLNMLRRILEKEPESPQAPKLKEKLQVYTELVKAKTLPPGISRSAQGTKKRPKPKKPYNAPGQSPFGNQGVPGASPRAVGAGTGRGRGGAVPGRGRGGAVPGRGRGGAVAGRGNLKYMRQRDQEKGATARVQQWRNRGNLEETKWQRPPQRQSGRPGPPQEPNPMNVMALLQGLSPGLQQQQHQHQHQHPQQQQQQQKNPLQAQLQSLQSQVQMLMGNKDASSTQSRSNQPRYQQTSPRVASQQQHGGNNQQSTPGGSRGQQRSPHPSGVKRQRKRRRTTSLSDMGGNRDGPSDSGRGSGYSGGYGNTGSSQRDYDSGAGHSSSQYADQDYRAPQADYGRGGASSGGMQQGGGRFSGISQGERYQDRPRKETATTANLLLELNDLISLNKRRGGAKASDQGRGGQSQSYRSSQDYDVPSKKRNTGYYGDSGSYYQ